MKKVMNLTNGDSPWGMAVRLGYPLRRLVVLQKYNKLLPPPYKHDKHSIPRRETS